MRLSCPACGKANADQSACARCGCELGDLHRIARMATLCLDEAKRALTQGDYLRASRESGRSFQFRRSTEAARLAFLANAAAGRTDAALQWRRLCHHPTRS